MSAWARSATPSRGFPVEGENADYASSDHADADTIVTLYPQEGMDQSMPPQQLPEGFSWDMLNLYYPREAKIPRTRPGVSLALDAEATAAAGPITTVYHHRYGDSSVTVVAALNAARATATDTDLYYVDANGDLVLILAGLGSLIPPEMVSFAGCVLITVKGEYLHEWQPANVGSDPVAVKASGTITFGDAAHLDDYATIGDRVYTWVAERELPGEVTVGLTAAACAANLVTAINEDSFEVTAAQGTGGSTHIVTVTSRRTGTIGNAVVFLVGLDAGAHLTWSPATGVLAGGVNGFAVDLINSGGPKPTTLCHGTAADLVTSGGALFPDRLYFSAPRNAWEWVTPSDAGGEFFDTGSDDGTSVTAISRYLDEIEIHKNGQGSYIKRIRIDAADPASWTLEDRGYIHGSAACNPRVAVSLSDKHLYLDNFAFMALTGTDTYDEVAAQVIGSRVSPFLEESIEPTQAFFVVDQRELILLIFPARGTNCCIFHYGSGRWTRWSFTAGNYTCGCYDATNRCVLLGDEDGFLYKLDPDVATDRGVGFSTVWETRALGEGSLKDQVVKEAMLDWTHRQSGQGQVHVIVNRGEQYQLIGEFAVSPSGTTCKQGVYISCVAGRDMPCAMVKHGRQMFAERGEGELVQMRVRLLAGALALNALALRGVGIGRAVR